MDNEGRIGEGSSSAMQARKRKAAQDDKPVIATRSKKRRINGNDKDHQVAKKAAPKRKQLRK